MEGEFQIVIDNQFSKTSLTSSLASNINPQIASLINIPGVDTGNG